jgi:hypothetical protein
MDGMRLCLGRGGRGKEGQIDGHYHWKSTRKTSYSNTRKLWPEGAPQKSA